MGKRRDYIEVDIFVIADNIICVSIDCILLCNVNEKGIVWWNLRVRGVEAHSGNDHKKGRNAIAALAHMLIEIDQWTNYDEWAFINYNFPSPPPPQKYQEIGREKKDV